MLAPYQLKPPHIILLLLVIQFSTINVLISNFASAADLNSQQLVLLDFLEQIPGLQSRWDIQTIHSYCSWSGITCANDNTNITSIIFPYITQQRGQIPASIKNLTQLLVLDTSTMSLGGTIPPELFDLEFLEELNFEYSVLTGIIPDNIGQCKSLKRINFFSNLLTGTIPSSMQNLSELEYLNLGRNNLTGPFPQWVVDLPKLTELWLVDNRLTCPLTHTTIEKLKVKNLTHCDLRMNQLDNSDYKLCGESWQVLGPCSFLPLKRQALSVTAPLVASYSDSTQHVEVRDTSLLVYVKNGREVYRDEYFMMEYYGFSERPFCSSNCDKPPKIVADVPMAPFTKLESNNPKVIKLQSNLINGATLDLTLDFEKRSGNGFKWSFTLRNWPFQQPNNYIVLMITPYMRVPHSEPGVHATWDGKILQCFENDTDLTGACESELFTGTAVLNLENSLPTVEFLQKSINLTFYLSYETTYMADGAPGFFAHAASVDSKAYMEPALSTTLVRNAIKFGVPIEIGPKEDQFMAYSINIYFPSFVEELVYDPVISVNTIFAFDDSLEPDDEQSVTEDNAKIVAAVVVPLGIVMVVAIVAVWYWRKRANYHKEQRRVARSVAMSPTTGASESASSWKRGIKGSEVTNSK